MANEDKPIQIYIDEKKELQELILQIIEMQDINDIDFEDLVNYLDTHQYDKNKAELGHFLHLISVISTNHFRQPYFFERIEKILTIASKFYKPIFSNEEMFSIFQESKPILLFLIKTQIITIDEIIFKCLLNFSETQENEKHYYFYPELISIIKSGTLANINEETYKTKLNEDIENFERNRQKFENCTKLCSIIREDLISDFVQYVHQHSISLTNQIERSIFETNSMLLSKSPTLIEYSFFYGSIQIIKYLDFNGVEMKPTLWLYAVHSNNAEIIQFLEDKEIEIDDRTFSEAIKCHHNNIAHHIYEKYLKNPEKIAQLSEENISIIYSSANFEFFSYEIDENAVFFSLCKNEYNEIINNYLDEIKNEIENYINQNNEYDIIRKSLKEKKLDIAYYLLSKFNCISENLLQYDEDIAKIALPSSIHSIFDYAFRGLMSLKQISIPSSLTSIGKEVFCGCSSLTQITIPFSVTSIEDHAFSECSSLTQITIPLSVNSIGYNAFFDCSSLTQISIPCSITEIKDCTFYGCSKLEKISIPSSVTLIGEDAFNGCSSLTQIIIPSSVSEIGKGAFCKCLSLTQISYEIPSSVKIIDEYVFRRCSLLTQILIPSSVTEIKHWAFDNCSSLTQIFIPSSVKFIGDYAFHKCLSLKQISIPPSVTKIGWDAFYECASLKEISIPSGFHTKDFGINLQVKISEI